jgi:RNA polymerase sigma-70 factor (ECF subfamily)
VLARVVGERSYAEIAAQVECSQALVRQRVSRGLATLRTQLSEER